MDILVAVLSSIYLTVGYLGLLPVRMKLRYCVLLSAYLFPIYYWIGAYFGQWLTIPLVLGCSLIIYFGCHRNILYLAFALTGHLILILENHTFTIPLSILGMSIP